MESVAASDGSSTRERDGDSGRNGPANACTPPSLTANKFHSVPPSPAPLSTFAHPILPRACLPSSSYGCMATPPALSAATSEAVWRHVPGRGRLHKPQMAIGNWMNTNRTGTAPQKKPEDAFREQDGEGDKREHEKKETDRDLDGFLVFGLHRLPFILSGLHVHPINVYEDREDICGRPPKTWCTSMPCPQYVELYVRRWQAHMSPRLSSGMTTSPPSPSTCTPRRLRSSELPSGMPFAPRAA